MNNISSYSLFIKEALSFSVDQSRIRLLETEVPSQLRSTYLSLKYVEIKPSRLWCNCQGILLSINKIFCRVSIIINVLFIKFCRHLKGNFKSYVIISFIPNFLQTYFVVSIQAIDAGITVVQSMLLAFHKECVTVTCVVVRLPQLSQNSITSTSPMVILSIG